MMTARAFMVSISGSSLSYIEESRNISQPGSCLWSHEAAGLLSQHYTNKGGVSR